LPVWRSVIQLWSHRSDSATTNRGTSLCADRVIRGWSSRLLPPVGRDFWTARQCLSENVIRASSLRSLDFPLCVAAFGIGIVVGLTGMGGGALMTPVLVLFFGVLPLTAVSSDLVASAVMKPIGALVHLRRGTVHIGLVKWRCVGSVPAAFGRVLLARALPEANRCRA
jgi:hypothetical protein